MKMRPLTGLALAGLAAALAVPPVAPAAPPKRPVYPSPMDVAFSPDGSQLVASDHVGGAAVIIRVESAKVEHRVELNGRPVGVAWAADGKFAFVAECRAGTVAQIDAASGSVTRRLRCGPWPTGLALLPRAGLLLVANHGTHSLSVLDLETGRERAKVSVTRMPWYVAVTPDEKTVVVGNTLPVGKATDPGITSAVSLIDAGTWKKLGDVRLPPNSVNVYGVAISPDGKWAYVVHSLAHATMPTTQLERGWLNTNAMSIIDIRKRALYATVLLDTLSRGAANPWGAAISADGANLWVGLSGTHQLGRADLVHLHKLLRGELPEGLDDNQLRARGYASVWLRIRDNPAKRKELRYDLSAMYGAKLFTRIGLQGKGPRGVAADPKHNRVAAAMYFSGGVAIVDGDAGNAVREIPVGIMPEPDETRRGEMIFHDATYCFQHWLSCATCHPAARVDGLNWDLLNDGMGNPKNTRSMLLSHETPPVMSRGVRPSMKVASRAGFKFILFREPQPGEHEAVEAYLRSLTPAGSPHLMNGRLSAKAQKGKVLFESLRTQCAKCHPAPLFTVKKLYDVGTRGELDRSGTFDTPTLIEMWRTAPYLHDGSAATLHEALRERNLGDKHGITSSLTDEELDALVAYILSL